MSETVGSNKAITKNAVYMYVRMFVQILISLYTSRAILDALGVEDYGVYNVVGGFVSMLSLFTASLQGATSRFIAYELGAGDKDKLTKTFATINTIMFLLAIFILLIGETIGIWAIQKYLVIPEERWDSALFVYHCSLFTFLVSIISLPYTSVITAHERFSFFAGVQIGQAFLKLVVVWLLYISPFDKLRIYAVLLVIVDLAIRLIQTIYCKKNFSETKVRFLIDKNIFKDIFQYSVWITVGATSAIFKEQGVNMLINMFCGVLMNAARGVSTQVLGLINNFGNAVGQVITPQITKSYAAGDSGRAIDLTFILAKTQGVLMILLAVPLIIETDYILSLWLKETPEYANVFVRWALILGLARTLENTHSPLFLATGKVRNLQLIGGGLMCLNLPFSWIALKAGLEPVSTMWIGVFLELVIMTVAYWFLRKLVNFPFAEFFKSAITPLFVLFFISFVPGIIIKSMMTEPSFLRLIINTFVTVITILALAYVLVLKKDERQMTVAFIKSEIKK